ncbi:MAG: hypothetical protein JRN20_06455 [Nitrososphaerota archaeon]|nr:hypothetical protein [Nitrososphaerota archaeon]
MFADEKNYGEKGTLQYGQSLVSGGREYPIWVGFLRAGLVLARLVVLIGAVQGELVWAREGNNLR